MRSADCLAHRSWRADVGIGPYEKTGSGSVGADFISARAPPRRMHRRRTHPYGEGNHRTPVRIIARFRAAIKAAPTAGMGDGATGGLPCTQKRAGRCGHRPYEKTGSGSVGADFISARAPPRRMHHRRTHPYGEGNHRTPVRIIARFRAAIKAAPTAGMGDGAVRRTALHAEAGGPMWASAPTRRTVEARREPPASGRPFFVHRFGLPLF